MRGALVLGREQARELDRLASEELAIPGLLLMENAGSGAAREAEELLGAEPRARVLVLCGGGNNGGDGFVLARHLHARGRDVLVAAVAHGAQGDAGVMRGIVERLGLPLLPAETEEQVRSLEHEAGEVSLVVDALLGTGFRGELRPELRRLTALGARAAARGARVLALDLPSGLDADSGRAAAGTLAAERTATFGALKRGLVLSEARPWVGEVRVVGLGFAAALVERLARAAGWTEAQRMG